MRDERKFREQIAVRMARRQALAENMARARAQEEAANLLTPALPVPEPQLAATDCGPKHSTVCPKDSPLRAAVGAVAAELPEPPKPLAWARRWHVDGEAPTQERSSKTGRMALAKKFKFLPVTPLRCLADDVPLFPLGAVAVDAAPQQPFTDDDDCPDRHPRA